MEASTPPCETLPGMFPRRPVGILLGYLADVAFGDPRRGHPVAGFGAVAGRLERLTYRDRRAAGALHTALLLIPLGAGAAPGGTVGGGGRGGDVGEPGRHVAGADRPEDGRCARPRRHRRRRGSVLPSLCGRDPAFLDRAGLTRAALESIAENTSDAQVAPLLWAAGGGVPGCAAVPGGQHARRDDRAPLAAVRAIRLGGSAVGRRRQLRRGPGRRRAGGRLRAVVGGSASGAWRAWRRDAAAHPSPNAGVVEAAFAGALGVRLGGPTQYRHELQIRPTLGDGRPPEVADLRRAVRLSRVVQAAARAGVAVAVALAQRRRP